MLADRHVRSQAGRPCPEGKWKASPCLPESVVHCCLHRPLIQVVPAEHKSPGSARAGSIPSLCATAKMILPTCSGLQKPEAARRLHWPAAGPPPCHPPRGVEAVQRQTRRRERSR